MQMPHHFDLAPDEWAVLRQLLDEALDMPAEARPTWVDALGPEHAAFKPRLRALLSHADEPRFEQLLQTLPKIDTSAFAGPAPPHEEAGSGPERQVGPYRLLRQIGEGGMAAVWLAERTDVLQGRQVALKLPHVSLQRSAWAERLAREREILATLNHPNIARLYDAGITADGQPYLALEYVEGQRIDMHCRERKLGLRERLHLFLQVTRAVAHAHARLVVHRDLKPSNILVGADGQARLLDFGIAKLLEQGLAQETALTLETGRALTPDYAAPEQIRGEPIGTAADIYSLGVVLFELLTDERPYKLLRDSRAVLEEAILQAQPLRPSDAASDAKLRKQLRGDLDTIVLKALKKTSAERYPTVDAMAADIERWLDHRPVLAQPDSRWYRARTFLARNRFAVGVAGGVSVALLSTAAMALWQMVEANGQRDAALLQQQRAEAFSEFMYVLFDDLGSGGKAMTVATLLDHGAAMLERQQGVDPALAAYMQYETARKYAMVHQTEKALSLLDRAVAGAATSGDKNLFAAAQCLAAWSLAYQDRARAGQRLAQAEQALAALRDVPVFTEADCLRARGLLLQLNGRVDEAITTLQRGIAALDRSMVPSASRRRQLMAQLADFYRATDRFKDALALSGAELDLVRASGSAGSMAELIARNNHAGNFQRMGELTRAAELLEAAHQSTLRSTSVAPPLGFRSVYAHTLVRLDQGHRALELADEEARLARQANSPHVLALSDLAAARALIVLKRLPEAKVRLDAAEAGWRADPKAYVRGLREAARTRAELLLASGQLDAARGVIDATLAQAGYPQRDDAPGLDRFLWQAGAIHLKAGDAAQAERLAGAALAIARRIARDEVQSADVGEAALLRGQARAALGRKDLAGTDAQLASEALRNSLGSGHPMTIEAGALLARLRQPS